MKNAVDTDGLGAAQSTLRHRPRENDAPQPTVVIEAVPDGILARLRTVWRYRGFYGFLVREITGRKARGSVFGFWILIIRPLIPVAMLIFMFSRLSPIDTGNVPYPVFFLSGYLPWRAFQSAMIYLPRTLTWTQSIMRRTYFPRLLVPLAGFGYTFIELAILVVAFAIVVLTSWNAGGSFPLHLGWHTLWLVPSLVAALLFALAVGLVMSIVALFFRDVIFTLRYFIQVVMFLTPVVYPITAVPESYRWVMFTVNPMAQVVMMSQLALTGQGELQLGFVFLSFATILAALCAGVLFFLRAERLLGDQL